jgi:hypothetical protein
MRDVVINSTTQKTWHTTRRSLVQKTWFLQRYKTTYMYWSLYSSCCSSPWGTRPVNKIRYCTMTSRSNDVVAFIISSRSINKLLLSFNLWEKLAYKSLRLCETSILPNIFHLPNFTQLRRQQKSLITLHTARITIEKNLSLEIIYEPKSKPEISLCLSLHSNA